MKNIWNLIIMAVINRHLLWFYLYVKLSILQFEGIWCNKILMKRINVLKKKNEEYKCRRFYIEYKIKTQLKNIGQNLYTTP